MTTERQNNGLSEKQQALLRELPSVDRLLRLPVTIDLIADYGRSLTLEALRATLEEQRTAVLAGATYLPMTAMLVQAAREWLEEWLAPTLRPVINATGVIIHTNLGRAPLSEVALAAVTAVSGSYSTLEYDLAVGQRGSRAIHAEKLIAQLTGAPAALAVNNNAGALLLLLSALCKGREVIISRGQLVEIGGGFRIPDVMAQSGARLVEVGTTNRTHLRDYAAAINENTAAILVAHYSNFKIIGFTTEPSLAELAELAHAHNLPLLYDQGSGALLDTAQFGLDPEPTVPESVAAGCDVVAFSGDKLLGGPQAGILCGRADLLTACKQHPLARALRADKMALAALSATLGHYVKEEALTAVPIWQMIARPLNDIEETAHTWAAQWQEHLLPAQVIEGHSTVGGGSLPGATLPTYLVSLAADNPDQLAAALRAQTTPVIGRIQDGRFLLDPRTVLPHQTSALIPALIKSWQQTTQLLDY